MKKKEWIILKNYGKEHLPVVAGFLVIVFTFYTVTALYGYDKSIRNMWYAVILTVFLLICFGAVGYLRYRKKCLALFRAMDNGGESDDFLPEPEGLTELLYYEIVYHNVEEKRRLVNELDEKKQDMSDYYTMWTHQIKTPIAALRLLLQGEQGKTLKEKRQGQALNELFKIEQYTEMALHYARLDSMSSDMLFVSYDINAIIKHAVKKYSILFIGSSLSFSMEDFTCRAVTDEKWLSFVVEQLLSNAIKYTLKGGIRIYGADRTGKEYQGKVSFVVIEDTGIGIRESDLPRVFERGFTGFNGRMDKRSTGIGLYLCRQIMNKLSHTIRIESVEGKGTRVTLGFLQNENS